MELSIVVPVFNEAESLPRLHEEIAALAAAQGYRLEIFFVDDGSTDGSWSVIRRLAQSDGRVRGIRFRRNFGKAAALSAGFASARGDLVVTLDADLQDDPAEIPNLIARINEGCDLVSGWKQIRHDPWHKVLPSRVFNWLVGALTGVKLHDHNCGLKCYRREVTTEVRLYGERHRFVPVLAAARGFRLGEVAVKHRPREFGQSKYGFSRFLKGFLDLLTVKFLTGFGQRPQHLLGGIGLGCFFIGLIGLIFLAAQWLFSRVLPGAEAIHLHERPALIYSVALLIMGGQFLSLGVVAELFISHYEPESPSYSVAERTDDASPTAAALPEKPETKD